MLKKTMTAAMLGSSLLATVAFAQTPSTSTPSTSTPSTSAAPAASTSTTASDSTSYTGDWRASKVVGLNVYNDGNESLGSINDILMNKDGQIQAVVIGVGGFLGVGERYVAIPYAKVKFMDEPVKTAAASAPASSGSAMPGTSPAATKPASSTMTTGAATGTGTATATPAATKNPWYPDHAVVSATKDELKGMTEFKYTTN